jgi:hypothetical protein
MAASPPPLIGPTVRQTVILDTSKKLLLGAATAWPVVYTLGFVAFVASSMMGIADGGGPIPSSFSTLMGLHIFTMLELVCLLVFYIVHAMKNKRLDQDRRLLWAILLFVGNVIAMWIYYFCHVWPAHREQA